MCGIYGIIKKSSLDQQDVDASIKALNKIKYRGPDHSGYWIDESKGIFLGHNRLSIIDCSDNNNQPAIYGKYKLIFNGEIYNYKNIRDRLIGLGHVFNTNGDTEVLIKGWAEWGEGVLEYIDGMYAFCLYDDDICHIVVDNFSEKSIFYKIKDGAVEFSSELSPLLGSKEIKKSISRNNIYSLLALGYIEAPNTFYENIYKLPLASILKIVNGEVVDIKKYWTIPKAPLNKGKVEPITEKYISEINEVLIESISSRLISDVPLCLFLSSGIDSILIASIIKKELSKDIDAITVSYKDTSVVDESYNASLAANYLGIKHEVIDANKTNTDVADIFNYYQQPNDNITISSVNQMCKVASERYKVGLTGLGADEIFFGYNKHISIYEKRKIFSMPEFFKKNIRSVSSSLKGVHRHFSSLADLYCVPSEYIYVALKNYPIIDWFETLEGFDAWAKDNFHCDLTNELSVPYYELEHTMQNSHLVAFDLGSMRNSMELRTPFLCKALLEKISEVDARALMHYGQKNILKRIMKRYLPDKFINNKKMGYIYPADKFLKQVNSYKPKLKEISSDSIKLAWDNRYENPSWSRLAIRLMMLDYMEVSPNK